MIEFVFHRLSQIICILSHQSVVRISRTLAGVIYFLYRLSPFRNNLNKNVQAALNLPLKTANQVSQEHFFQLLTSIAELLRFPQLGKGEGAFKLEFKGFEHLIESHAQGKGVVIVTAHYGLWELLPAVLALQGFESHVLVQRPTNPSFDRLFTQFRTSVGVHTHYNTETRGLKRVLKALKCGDIVSLAVDQHGEAETLIGSFFGHTVSFPEGPVFFAKRSQSPLLPVFVYRKNNTHVFECLPPLPAPPPHPSKKESLAIMQSIHNIFETMIAAHPEAWLWTYNRWDKYNPRV